MHSKLPVAVITVLKRENKILLLRRKNTPWLNWYWWFPGGRLDAWESMTSWAIRELKEEVWVEITPKNINFKAVIHHKDERWERIYFIIEVENFSQKPKNIEEDKAEEIKWFNIDNLPEKITPQVKICLDVVKKRICYSEYWFKKKEIV